MWLPRRLEAPAFREELRETIPAGGTKTGYGEYHAWFKAELVIPQSMKGRDVELCIRSGRRGYHPQYIAYLDGKIVQGVDGNHETFPIDSEKERQELTVYGFGGRPEELYLEAELQRIDVYTRELWYSLRVPAEVMDYLPFEGKEYCEIRTALNEAINLIDFRERDSNEYHASVKKALSYLYKEFYDKKCGKQMANVVCIGHSHIDTAWLWPVRQTREKCQRTFSTAVNMMKEFPEYKFITSQPQQFQFIKENEPELFEEVKEMVKSGNWEIEGAMWVEPDCNLPSGEVTVPSASARQTVHETGVRRGFQDSLASRRIRLLRGFAPDPEEGRCDPVRDLQDLLERDQHAPQRCVPVAGHRRDGDSGLLHDSPGLQPQGEAQQRHHL